jgi:poly(ADP-ribose) glycohydrolase ARH3
MKSKLPTRRSATNTKPSVLLGLAAGDSLGQPFETIGNTIHPDLAAWDGKYRDGNWKTRMTNTLDGQVPLRHLPAGSTTDDTDFAVALVDALLMHGYYNPQDAAMAYLHLARLNLPNGMGGSLQKAMQALDRGKSWEESGVKFDDPAAVGNGAVMRVAPLAVYFHNENYALMETVRLDAVITHNHREAEAGNEIIAMIIAAGLDRQRSVNFTMGYESGYDDTLVFQTLARARVCKTPDELFATIGRRGNVAQTVATAVWCADNCDNDFAAGIQMAVRGGGDTDTRAAITGAILGARVGLDGIPAWMRDGLDGGSYGSERLIEMDAALVRGPGVAAE